MANIDDDDDAYDALGLYKNYLGSLVRQEDEFGTHQVEHGMLLLSDEEASVRSEEVQLYGQFMRSLITNEGDEERTNELNLPFGGEDDDELGTEGKNDRLIGKTVVAESSSSSKRDKLGRELWINESLSYKNTENEFASAQELLVQDTKCHLPSIHVHTPKETRLRIARDAKLTKGSDSKVTESISTFASSSDKSVSHQTKRKSTNNALGEEVLPTHDASSSGGAPDTKSTSRVSVGQETDTGKRMYDVPWLSRQLVRMSKNTKSGLNDEEVPSSEKPKTRLRKCVYCIQSFFSTPMRCATVLMMTCHFVTAIISLASFVHRLQCCDERVDLKSYGVFRIVSSVFLLWVLLQILPVVVKGHVRFWTIPNTYFGFILASTLALHSFFWLAVAVFVLELTALTLQLVMVHVKDFRWRWVRLVISLMPVILCLAHVFLVFVNATGQCVVNTNEGWYRTGDDACIICTGDNLPLILDKYRDPCLRPSTRYSSDVWGERGDYCGSETNKFCFYSYAG